jgi:uncharacterized cupin superfamily protein
VAPPSNVWKVECAPGDDWPDGVRAARLLDRSRRPRLVSATWELDPGASSPHYHLHHATEELLVLLAGRATLRTPEGERPLEPGDVVHFPAGATGAHQVLNRSDEVVRYLMVAAHGAVDAVEYVDEQRVVVYSHRPSLVQDGTLFFSHDARSEG